LLSAPIETPFPLLDKGCSPGGYLRILKTGLSTGDKAPMACIELVDRPQVEEEAVI
jgi:hypothetical protein